MSAIKMYCVIVHVGQFEKLRNNQCSVDTKVNEPGYKIVGRRLAAKRNRSSSRSQAHSGKACR